MRISDWSSDVCSADLRLRVVAEHAFAKPRTRCGFEAGGVGERIDAVVDRLPEYRFRRIQPPPHARVDRALPREHEHHVAVARRPAASGGRRQLRSEEHTSELQSLMRNSYAVFCLKKKKDNRHNTDHKQITITS